MIFSGITIDLRVIGRFLEVPRQQSSLALNSLRRFFGWKMGLKEKTGIESYVTTRFILVVQYLNININ